VAISISRGAGLLRTTWHTDRSTTRKSKKEYDSERSSDTLVQVPRRGGRHTAFTLFADESYPETRGQRPNLQTRFCRVEAFSRTTAWPASICG